MCWWFPHANTRIFIQLASDFLAVLKSKQLHAAVIRDNTGTPARKIYCIPWMKVNWKELSKVNKNWKKVNKKINKWKPTHSVFCELSIYMARIIIFYDHTTWTSILNLSPLVSIVKLLKPNLLCCNIIKGDLGGQKMFWIDWILWGKNLGVV